MDIRIFVLTSGLYILVLAFTSMLLVLSNIRKCILECRPVRFPAVYEFDNNYEVRLVLDNIRLDQDTKILVRNDL